MVVKDMNILEEAQNYCKDIVNNIVKKHNETYTQSYEHLNIFVEFSNRLSRRLGYCRTYRDRRTCEITLSNLFLKSCWNREDKEGIRELVIHEVAHAVVRVLYGFGHGHDSMFEKTVVRLGGNLTKRSSNFSEYKPYRYIYRCPNCNKIIKSKKKRVGACAKCCDEFNNGNYTDKYKWVLVEDKGRVENWD